MENEQMYPYTAKEARERGELEQWRPTTVPTAPVPEP